jgi:hypothetical protein
VRSPKDWTTLSGALPADERRLEDQMSIEFRRENSVRDGRSTEIPGGDRSETRGVGLRPESEIPAVARVMRLRCWLVAWRVPCLDPAGNQ